MEKFLKNQQIPLTQVIDPNTGQVYYSTQNVVYQDKNNTGPTYLRNVIVDNATSASYALTASYALNGGGGGSTNTGSLLTTASFSNPNLIFTKGNGSTFNVNLSTLIPTSASYATTASYAANGGVTQIIAGTNISISPTNGLGAVTINSTGGGGTGTNTTASFSNLATWTFNHGLNSQYPIIQVLNSSFEQIVPQSVTLTNPNTVVITFPTSESGYAIASLGGVGTYAVTASYALTALSASWAPGGGGAAFPYTGSAQITGSLGVTGSINGLLVGRGNGNVSTNVSIGATTAFSSSLTGINNIAIGNQPLKTNTSGRGNTALGYRSLYTNTIGNYNIAVGNYALGKNTSGGCNIALGYRSLYKNTTGERNVSLGFYSLYFNTTGCFNTALSTKALRYNSTACHNSAIGYKAMYNTTTGGKNFAAGGFALGLNTTGLSNTAIGYLALNSNTTGNSNTAIGAYALRYNTTGSHNHAFGESALRYNTTGQFNTAIGPDVLRYNTTGNSNTAIGNTALFLNLTGNHNTAIGFFSLNSNTTGNYNTAIGKQSLYSNTTGNYNTAIGAQVLLNNTTGFNNTAIGYRALRANTTGAYNLALGYFALYSNTTGNYNTAIGTAALGQNSTGGYNTAIGLRALNQNTTGFSNHAFGRNALYCNTTGAYNTAIGNSALYSNTTGQSNTAIGNNALRANTTGNYNTAIGLSALRYNTTGGNNTAIGSEALSCNTTGGYNTAIGQNALRNNTTGSNNIAFGLKSNSAISSSQNNIVIGTNIGVAESSANRINIGGLIFGSGSYANSSSAVFSGSANGFVGINQPTPRYNLDVSGSGNYSNNLTLTGSLFQSGSHIIISPSSTPLIVGGITSGGGAAISASGYGTKGGSAYLDFLQVTNTTGSATNPTKYFRIDNTGNFQIINSSYGQNIFQLSDIGNLYVNGATTAGVSNNDGISGSLMFNNNHSQIYDDGNMHIHSRISGDSMWINTNNAQLNLLTQIPIVGGASGSGVAIGSTNLIGYVTINNGKSYTTSANYGYLTTSGAGTYPGGSQTVNISLYATQRIWGQEIDAFSDERMKDIQGEISLEDGLKLVKTLTPIQYIWKEGGDKGLKAGYSAQQVSKAGFDHLISLIPKEGLEETIDEDGFVSPKDTQFAMNYDQVTPYHGVVIKHLLEKIEQLEQKINQLEQPTK